MKLQSDHFWHCQLLSLPKEKCKAEKDKVASKSKKKKIPKKQGQDIRAFFESTEMNSYNDDDSEIDVRISEKTRQMSQL